MFNFFTRVASSLWGMVTQGHTVAVPPCASHYGKCCIRCALGGYLFASFQPPLYSGRVCCYENVRKQSRLFANLSKMYKVLFTPKYRSAMKVPAPYTLAWRVSINPQLDIVSQSWLLASGLRSISQCNLASLGWIRKIHGIRAFSPRVDLA